MLNIYVKTRYLQNKPYSWTGNMNLTATLILENIVFLLYKEEIPEFNKINSQTRCLLKFTLDILVNIDPFVNKSITKTFKI